MGSGGGDEQGGEKTTASPPILLSGKTNGSEVSKLVASFASVGSVLIDLRTKIEHMRG